MRILVIGGTRFIGLTTVRLLSQQGHTVAVFHRGQAQADLPQGVQQIRGDKQTLPRLSKHSRILLPTLCWI